MRLIELIVLGVPGTRGALRYPFQPGLNPWRQKGTFRLEHLVSILESLLYPSKAQGMPMGPGKAQKAGMTFEARSDTYRLLRDYVGKKGSLAQLERGSREQYRELSREPHFIAETLRRTVQVPPAHIFRHLFIAQPGREGLDSSVASGGAAHWDFEEGKGADLRSAQQRLEQLRREQEHVRKLEELEMRQNELQAQLFKVDEALRQFDEPRSRRKQIKEDCDPYRVLDQPGLVTPQLRTRLNAYPRRIEERENELRRLDESELAWNQEFSSIVDRPLWLEPLALVGALIALAAFVGATFTRPWPWAFWSCLGCVIGGLATAGFGILAGMRRLDRRGDLKTRIQNLETEKAGIEKRFEIETVPVRKILELLQTQDSEEAKDLMKRHDNLALELKKVEEELTTLEAKFPQSELKSQRSDLAEKLNAIDQELQKIPPVSMDPNTIKRQIRELELSLQVTSGGVPQNTVDAEDDDVNQLIGLGAQILQRPVSDVMASIERGISMNIRTLTGDRFNGVVVSKGRVEAFRVAAGAPVSWRAADRETRAQLFFAVQFTLWQLLASPGSAENCMPFVLDLLSCPVPRKTADLYLAASRHLSNRAQVLVVAP